MEFWIFATIVGGIVLTVLGWLFWILVFGAIAKKSIDTMNSLNIGRGTGGGAGLGELYGLFAQLEQVLRAASNLNGTGGSSVI